MCSPWETSDYKREEESAISAPPLAFSPPKHKEENGSNSAESKITNIDKQ
jgi:hypothetical protein